MYAPDAAWQALNVCPLGLMLSTHHLVRWCNPRFAQTLGYERFQLSGRHLALLHPGGETTEAANEPALRRLRAEGGYRGERLLRRRDGSLLWCRVRGEATDRGDPFLGVCWTLEPLLEPLESGGHGEGEDGPIELSLRERQVLVQMVQGRSGQACADRLGMSLRTVEKLRGELRERFGVHNAAELPGRIGGLPHG